MDRIQLLRALHHGQSTYLLYEEILDNRIGYSVAICHQDTRFAFASDITHDQGAAERFLTLICEGGLDPCHLYDVLEDLLPLS